MNSIDRILSGEDIVKVISEVAVFNGGFAGQRVIVHLHNKNEYLDVAKALANFGNPDKLLSIVELPNKTGFEVYIDMKSNREAVKFVTSLLQSKGVNIKT